MRVLLIDEQPMFTQALALIFDAQPDLTVIGHARTKGEALACLARERPGLAVLDPGLGHDLGLDLVTQLLERDPALLVVVLAGGAEVGQVTDAIQRGAVAWVDKSAPVDHLLGVVRGVRSDEYHIPPYILGGVLRALLNANGKVLVGPLSILTPREREVLQHLVDGNGRAEIAQRLFLSPNTVRTHTQSLLSKLGVHSGVEAVALAMRHGLRPSPSGRPTWDPARR